MFGFESFFTVNPSSSRSNHDTSSDLGIQTMANVELGNWVLNAAEGEQVREADQERERARSQNFLARTFHRPHHYKIPDGAL